MVLVYACVFVALLVIYKLLHLDQNPEAPRIYGRDAHFIDFVTKTCPILTDGYFPTALWGKSGHMQTTVQSVIGRKHVPTGQDERIFVDLDDGARFCFDIYHSRKAHHSGKDLTLAVCPGVGGSSDTAYIQAFVHYAVKSGYRCAILNHIGALKGIPLAAPRMFAYGGTSEIETMVREVLKRYENTQVVCLGFSMGGNIVTKFLASPLMFEASLESDQSCDEENEEDGCDCDEDSGFGEDRCKTRNQQDVDWSRVLCGISICQFYEAVKLADLLLDWENLRRFYLLKMTYAMQNLVRRNKSVLLSDAVKLRCQIDEQSVFSATTLKAFDEAYTRRVFGYRTVEEMYKDWSSAYWLKEVKRPMVFVNSADDPIVPLPLLEIIRDHVENADNCMYIESLHGGHLGFFEGGVLIPRKHGWLDRLSIQLSDSLVAFSSSPDIHLHRNAAVPLPPLSARRRSGRRDARENERRVRNAPPKLLKHLSSLAC